MSNSMGIRRFDFVEFYVGSAKMVSYWYQKAMGFTLKAYKGPETGHKKTSSYFLQNGDFKLVITAPVCPEHAPSMSFLQNHGDGVKRFAYEVDNVEACFNKVVKNGGIPITVPTEESNGQGSVFHAAIRIYDDTEITLINYDNFKGLFRPGFEEPVQKFNMECTPTNLGHIDHIVGNVRTNEMDHWSDYFVRAFEFEEFIRFGPGDISTKYSALLSKVVRSSDFAIRNPINEPFEGLRKSQIEEYLDVYKGSGVQHIAIASPNILDSIRALRKNGVEFLNVPKTYYEDLKQQGKQDIIEHDLDELAELGILCDTEDLSGTDGYLLQLFTKPIGDRPSFFFEIIQRCGDSQGFGQGNFQALFEAIEREQERRGNL